MSDPSRRDFLGIMTTALLSASGLLGLGGLLRFLHFQTETPPRTEFDLGAAEDYPVGTSTLLPDVPAVLIHTQDGFSAMSLLCTHLGCTVKPDSGGFVCPCHGSRYDQNGSVLRGAAPKALHSLRVETRDDGHLHLYST